MRSATKPFGGVFRSLLPAAAGFLLLALAACVPPPVDPGPVGATRDRTLVISVMFDFDSHRIRPEYYGELNVVADALVSQQLAGYAFDVAGHTDRIGRLAYNIALSELRAGAVISYLASRGVARERMRAQGFGYLVPLDPANPFSPVNRRVEVTSIR